MACWLRYRQSLGSSPLAERRSFLFRGNPDLLDALRRWADDELRSVNGQLEFILRRALRDSGRLPKKADEDPGTTDQIET